MSEEIKELTLENLEIHPPNPVPIFEELKPTENGDIPFASSIPSECQVEDAPTEEKHTLQPIDISAVTAGIFHNFSNLYEVTLSEDSERISVKPSDQNAVQILQICYNYLRAAYPNLDQKVYWATMVNAIKFLKVDAPKLVKDRITDEQAAAIFMAGSTARFLDNTLKNPQSDLTS
jgi:hypothetical protein